MAENYADYLERLRAGLKSGCGGGRTDLIFAEAKAHLDEGIEELVLTGMSRQAAEEAAVSRFGDADSVCKWYAEQHRRPSVWRASRWPLAGAFLGLFLWMFQGLILPVQLEIHFGSLILLNSALALTIVLCFRCKRFVSGVIALAAGGLYVLMVSGFCLFSVPVRWQHGYGVVARWSADSTVKEARERIALHEQQLATFEDGRKAFTPAFEPPEGVGRFRDSRGYLTPIYYQTQDPRVHVYFGDQEVNGIFQTYKEARDMWIRQPDMFSTALGKSDIYYISETADELAQDRDIVRWMPTALTLPLSAKLPVFLQCATYAAYFLLGFGVIADLAGGMLRMVAQWVRQRRRPGPLTS